MKKFSELLVGDIIYVMVHLNMEIVPKTISVLEIIGDNINMKFEPCTNGYPTIDRCNICVDEDTKFIKNTNLLSDSPASERTFYSCSKVAYAGLFKEKCDIERKLDSINRNLDNIYI